MPPARRPKAVVWTGERISEGQSTGIRPPVAVWTPAQTATFLNCIRHHRLYAAYHLIALDRTTVAALRAHRSRQLAERAAAGEDYLDSGYVFTRPSGASWLLTGCRATSGSSTPPADCRLSASTISATAPPASRKPAELHPMHRGTGFGGSRDRCALRVLACRGGIGGGRRAWQHAR